MGAGLSNAASPNPQSLLAGRTAIVESGTNDGAATSTTLYTVTAGKTFYLVSATMNYFNRITATIPSWGALKVGSSNILIVESCAIAGGDAIYVNQSNSLAPALPLPFPAGTVFYLAKSSASTQHRTSGSIFGWEE